MTSPMTQGTHTPGPWTTIHDGWKPWTGAIEVRADGIQPDSTICWTPSGGNEAANARLIAAAPTMKADIDEFMRRLGPRWFLEQNWFPASLNKEGQP